MWLNAIIFALSLGPIAVLIAIFATSLKLRSGFLELLMGRRLLFFVLSLLPLFVFWTNLIDLPENPPVLTYITMPTFAVSWIAAMVMMSLYYEDKEYRY